MMDKKAIITEKETLLNLKYTIAQLESKKQASFKLEDNKLSAGVLNQVDANIKNYCEQKGYTLLLGASPGMILYAGETINITEDLLIELNKKYQGVE